jgi:hypothetical protein
MENENVEVNQMLEMAGIEAVETVQKPDTTEKEAGQQKPEAESSTDNKTADESSKEDEKIEDAKKVDKSSKEKVEEDEDADDDESMPKGVQKRIGKLTKKFKEAEERLLAKEQRVAELENKLNTFEKTYKKADEPKTENSYALSKEEQAEIIYEKAVKKIIEEDKNKPVEKRRLMTKDEINDLISESPYDYDNYIQRERKILAEIKSSIDGDFTKSEKKQENSQELPEGYVEFAKEYPELDYAETLKTVLKTVDFKDEEKFIAALKAKNENVADFFLFMKENHEKYSSLEKAARAFTKQNSDNRFKKLEAEKLRLENEIERLKSLDIGLKSSNGGSSKKTLTADEKKLESEVAELIEAAGIR